MTTLWCVAITCVIAPCSFLWLIRRRHVERRRRLRERVAYMLWVMADQTEDRESSVLTS